jgi:hypothetical protein
MRFDSRILQFGAWPIYHSSVWSVIKKKESGSGPSGEFLF